MIKCISFFCVSLFNIWAFASNSDYHKTQSQLNITIHVRVMEPVRWSSQTVSGDYYLKLRNDSVAVYLPYRGTAYRSTPQTFLPHFRAPVSGIRIRRKKKGGVEYSFQVVYQAETYAFSLSLYPNRCAQIYLVPSHAESIRYQGTY